MERGWKMSNSDYMTEWELKKAKEQACGQRLLEAVQNEIRDISEQVVDLAREKQDEISRDFKNLWAICFQVARGDPADFTSYGDCIRNYVANCWMSELNSPSQLLRFGMT